VEGLVDKEQQPCLLLSRGPGQGSLVAVERSGSAAGREADCPLQPVVNQVFLTGML
jgi:hypothetical protein